MKKVLLSLISVMITGKALAVNTCDADKLNVSCWECGSNCTLDLDVSTGVVNVTGSGRMGELSEVPGSTWCFPWNNKLSLIKKVNVTGNFTYISGAFNGARQMTELTLPDSVTEIGSYAFYYAQSLKNVILPSNLTKIGNNAFNQAVSLQNIIIPKKVKDIGAGAFSNESNLESITFLGDEIIFPYKDSPWTSFGGTTSLLRVFCHESIQEVCEKELLHSGLDASKILKTYIKKGDYYISNEKKYRSVIDMYNGNEIKRIYNVDEAMAALGKTGKNTFSIRYQ